MQLRLISHRACPFVQRAVIVLLEKHVAHEVEYVDLQNRPPWFTALSPRGKVPLLVADGATLFESAAICEFLEETHTEAPLMPADPIGRARDRGWTAFASEDLFAPIYKISVTAKPEELTAITVALDKSLGRLDDELGDRQWLSGDGSRFGMADVMIAPFFVRAHVVATVASSPIPERFRRVHAYATRVLARESVVKSTPSGFAADMIKRMQTAQAAVLREVSPK